MKTNFIEVLGLMLFGIGIGNLNTQYWFVSCILIGIGATLMSQYKDDNNDNKK